MSQRILNAHTGECLFADLDTCETLEGLKRWIAKNTGIGEKRQVLLTIRGKQAKLQTLRNGENIFVYDRELIQASNSQSEPFPIQTAQFSFPEFESLPPGPIGNGDLEQWLKAAHARARWAEKCRDISEKGRKPATEIAIIQQGTAIAVDNLKQHLASLQQRQRQAQDWVESLVTAQNTFEKERETLISRLAAIPAIGQLQRYLKNTQHTQSGATSLLDLLGAANLDDLAAAAGKVSRKLQNLMGDINANYTDVSEKGASIIEDFGSIFVSSTGDLLEALDSHLEEQNVLCGKIYEDCFNFIRNDPQDTVQLAKIFNRHDKNLLPSLLTTFGDIETTVRQITERKQHIMEEAIACMQRVSGAESSIGQIGQSFGQLELNPEEDAALDSLDSVYRLPSVYGSLLIEIVRRREWTEKMTSDSTSLAEEMATYQDEEERRRKKWLKSMGNYLGSDLGSDVMGIDISVRSSGSTLPGIARNEAVKYIDTLKKVGGFEDAIQDLAPMLKAIDAPSKQQARRASAFRNGSVNDATFGQNSLLLRGEGDLIRTLQAEKTKLEERLKGADSRVRRLEDVLHRQSQIQSRPSSRGVGSFPYDRQATPTALDGFSRVPVIPQSPGVYGSRRSSLVAQLQEQNPTLAQLEADLHAERLKTARLEDLTSKQQREEETLRTQAQEAASTKQDLMDNFQAQQNEFEGERRLLEDENRKLKVKVDELEEDIDRILGSHDNARLGLDERTKAFEQELRSHRERAVEERAEYDRLQGELDSTRHEAEEGKKTVSRNESRILELEALVQKYEDSQKEHGRSLRATHFQLANDENAPTNYEALVSAVEHLSRKASNHLQDLQQAVDKARSETSSQAKQLEVRTAENNHLKSRVEEEELKVFSLHEEVSDRKARYASLETELEDQRQDLENVRTKFAESETLVQTIREKLRSEERKSQELNTDLVSTKTRRVQADNDLSRLHEKLTIIEGVRNTQSLLLEARGRNAEDVSSRLYAQNELLLRLLSQIGFTATRDNGTYAFERTSKLANMGSTMLDSSPPMSRTSTGNMVSGPGAPRPASVQWASSDDLNTEKDMFQEYIKDIGSLRMDVVFETLAKRYKDVEHTARKWQREAKNYRERFHKSQFDAQNKIAYRNFKEGDLALFLPTRNQAPKRSWAAFNVGAPHYFLREQEHHTLKSRDWLVARISRVEERVVDLSRGLGSDVAMGSIKENLAADDNASTTTEDDNPFGLSDGLRWYYLDAAEERLGAAPTTPGLGKSTVASAPQHATASSILAAKKKPGEVNAATKVLTKSLDSRRSSTNSKKSTAGAIASTTNATGTFDTGHGEGGGAAAAAAAASAAAGTTTVATADRSSLRRPSSKESEPPQESRREQGWSSLWSVDVSLESGKKDSPK